MNIIGKPDVYEMPFSKWYDKNITQLIDRTPRIGEMKVQWFPSAFAEGVGEFVTVERWNGESWECDSLDVNMTVEDLIDLNNKLIGEKYEC